MALLENRSRVKNNVIEFTSFLISMLRASIAAVLLILSLYVAYFSSSGRISILALETTGDLLSISFNFYDKIFDTINKGKSYITSWHELHNENLALKLENARLKQNIVELQLLKNDNEQLRRLLNFVEDKKFNRISARIFNISTTPFGRSGLINKGTDAGIISGQVVINEQGLVGRIIEVSNSYSRVLFASDLHSRVPIFTSQTNERAILAGNNKNCELIFVADNSNIQVGELILTSGDGMYYPRGLPVAKVSSIQNNKIEAELLFNQVQSDVVSIIQAVED